MTFNYTLTIKDKALTKAFRARLERDNKEYFTSDDFRKYGLDKLMSDPIHEVGSYFAKLKFHWIIRRVGEKPSGINSNHSRRVDLWEWGAAVEGWLNSPTMEKFL